MARRRMTRARTELSRGVAYDVLAQEIMRSADFQQVIARLGDQLRQLGARLGRELQDELFGAAFAPSEAQVGALLQELLGKGEGIL